MVGDRYVAVLFEFGQLVNPEPGVPRAPTTGEQLRALGRRSVHLGGELDEQVVAVREGRLADSRIELEAAARRVEVEGMLLISMEALRGPVGFDLDLLAALWRDVGTLEFMIENIVVHDDAEFEALLDHLIVTNAVRERDTTDGWRRLVESGATT